MADIKMQDTTQSASKKEKKSHESGVLEDHLIYYYDRLFPVDDIIKWLSYGNDSKHPEANGTYIQRREFCFTLPRDIFARYQSFPDVKALREALLHKCPMKIDIGPVYNVDPRKRAIHTGVGQGFQCVERELVFDIDVSDYNDVRTCCKADSMCNKDWAFMAAAIIILDTGLREDFGFQHILWVYSGRRGIHCWVCDKRARILSDKERSSIVSYFTIYLGQVRGQAKLNIISTSHPAIQRALQVCNDVWINRILPEQQLFESESHAEVIFAKIDERSSILLAKKAMPSREEDINQSTWRVLEREVRKKAIKETQTRRKRELVHSLSEVILMHVYPRLDIEVSKKMNHLLKAPFCVHPKTGKICVPISPEQVWQFSPEDVPTVADLIDQSNAGVDLESTDLRPYVELFRTFLGSLNSANLTDLTSRAKAKNQDSIFTW